MNPAGQPDPTTQYAQLKSAILGGQQAGGGVSIIGNSPELAKLYGAQGLNPSDIGSAKIAGSSYNAGVQVANAKAAADAAASAQNDMLDPSKYRQVAAQDGGFNFFAPNGQPISASQYAQITNKSEADVLKNSQNPIDKAFIQDYNQLQDYINNKNNSKNDPAARSAAQSTETQVRKLYKIDLHLQDPTKVIAAFQQAYPTVYGGAAATAANPWSGAQAGRQGNQVLLPNAAAIKATQANYTPSSNGGGKVGSSTNY